MEVIIYVDFAYGELLTAIRHYQNKCHSILQKKENKEYIVFTILFFSFTVNMAYSTQWSGFDADAAVFDESSKLDECAALWLAWTSKLLLISTLI